MADRRGDAALDKPMPNNVEAERLILGVILLDNSTINQAAERLKPDDFFLPSHRRIYEKMIYLYEQGRAIDPLTLQEELRRAGELEQVGGAAYIASLFDGVPRFSNLDNYTRITKGKSMLRQLIRAASQVMTMAFDEEEEPELILDQAERLILGVAEDRIKQGFTPLSQVAERQLKHIEEIAGHGQLITGIATGFKELDLMTSGLQRGELIIVAARPSMGKCLAADAEIVLADGRIATIEEIYRSRAARLLTLGDDFKFKLAAPSAFVDDGMKPVYRVTTRLGRTVVSTLPHPYLTVDGWRKLAELKVGDHIAVPRRLEVFGTTRWPEDKIELLACRLGNDDLTDSDAKFIPAEIFQLTKPQLALFLNRLFATGGWVVLNKGQEPQLSYASGSAKLARQVQHLLLRFGIIARLHRKEVKHVGSRRLSWQLDIAGECLEALKGPNSIAGGVAPGQPPCGPDPERVEFDFECNPFRVGNPYAAFRGRRPRLLNLALSGPLRHVADLAALAQSDVYWDEIISIECLGEQQVYDLTIPETHNFVANDVCVHNTAFCLNVAQNAALRPQHHGEKAVVGFFSLEMSKEQLVNRMLCSQARIDAHRLRSGMLSKDDWRKLALAVGELSEAKFFLDDTPGMSVLEMRAKARRLKNEQKALDLIVIDYMQLMSGRGRVESRQQEVSQISRELKMLAKELNVPLIALSQLSRAPEARTGSRPQLSDLRESGSIEQDADVVMFIYREDYYKPETEKQNIAEIIVGKQRNGPTGNVELVFLKQLTKFEDKYREG